jgi:hypothetical protein
VFYTNKQTDKSAQDLENLVRTAIAQYSNSFLDDFGSTLQISRLSNVIDQLDTGILSNTMEANPIIDYSPPIILKQNPQFKFNSPLITPYPFDSTENISNYVPAIKSSPYRYNGIEVFFQDDGRGNITILSSNIQAVQVLNPAGGTVDYSTGLVKLVNFTTDGYTGPAIKIYANTTDKNIIAPKNRIFSIRDADVTVNMIETQ